MSAPEGACRNVYANDPSSAAMIFAVLLAAAWLGCLARSWRGQIGLFSALFAVWLTLVVLNAISFYREPSIQFSIGTIVIVSAAPAILLWVVSIPIARAPQGLPLRKMLLRGVLGASIAFVLTPIVLLSCSVH